MELRQLRFFTEVARAGTFLKAAERLHMAQPSLWRQVKALETDLDVALFERSGRGVVLTGAGRQLLPRAQALLAQAGAFEALATELGHGRTGMVTVSCAHPHVSRFLAPLIGTFAAAHPGIHVALRESRGLPPVEHALDGEADFVTALPCADPRLTGTCLGDVSLVIVTSDDHPWRDRASVAVPELSGEAILTAGPGSLTRSLLDPAARDAGLTLDIVGESSNPSTTFSMARAGLGVGIMADDTITTTEPGAWGRKNPADELRAVPWPRLADDRHPMSTSVWMYRAAGRDPGPAAAAFAAHVTAVAAGHASRASKTPSS